LELVLDQHLRFPLTPRVSHLLPLLVLRWNIIVIIRTRFVMSRCLTMEHGGLEVTRGTIRVSVSDGGITGLVVLTSSVHVGLGSIIAVIVSGCFDGVERGLHGPLVFGVERRLGCVLGGSVGS
jgi:hypothetical protein